MSACHVSRALQRFCPALLLLCWGVRVRLLPCRLPAWALLYTQTSPAEGAPHCLLQGMRVLDNACDVSIDSAEEPLALWDILEK